MSSHAPNPTDPGASHHEKEGAAHEHHGPWWKDPLRWGLAALAGLVVGALLTFVLKPVYHQTSGHVVATITPILVVPFALLLGCVALMPFVNARWWHHHYPEVALALGGVVTGYFLVGYREPVNPGGLPFGAYAMSHAAEEFYSFLALVGGLYVVSGSIVVELRGRGRPLLNTALLALGAVLANLVGTTGASVLLIRPFMKINHGRLRPIHIVFFIFIVSNCGGCLTPIGDPPLYLGFLKGVPFFWTAEYLWQSWLIVNGLLLAIFFAVDTRLERTLARRGELGEVQEHALRLRVHGVGGMICLALMIGGVLIDPLLRPRLGLHHFPVGATFQMAVAIIAYFVAPRYAHEANEFNFGPIKEVGLLFAGIFATMVPALGYLAANGSKLGLDSVSAYYWGTGLLSALLDNAPTYLNFLQIAFGEREMNPVTLREFTSTVEGTLLLEAISTGAVFFGAMTYIGNGPNFMVKAIAEQRGMKMPSFFGYLGISCAFLLPVLVAHWAIRLL
jgi:Na+/H+ antiporter NhaD/arsenite permease-like protein